ncbi:hypothetical protein Ancab_020327 [Ancistrocladus abbreviatus]
MSFLHLGVFHVILVSLQFFALLVSYHCLFYLQKKERLSQYRMVFYTSKLAPKAIELKSLAMDADHNSLPSWFIYMGNLCKFASIFNIRLLVFDTCRHVFF